MKKTPDAKKKVVVLAVLVIILCAVWAKTLPAVLACAEPRTVTSVRYSSYPVPQPLYVDVEKIVPTITTVEIDRPVIIEKVKEVPRDVPVALKDWDSPAQLAEFLKNDDTDRCIILYMDDSGKAAFNGQCEDLALQLRDRAMAAGRHLSIEVLNPEEYKKWYGQSVGSGNYHAICMARIGNEFWYIEPSNDKCWLAVYLD
jgi:hypothetical protein